MREPRPRSSVRRWRQASAELLEVRNRLRDGRDCHYGQVRPGMRKGLVQLAERDEEHRRSGVADRDCLLRHTADFTDLPE